jgi:hypothetical protein
MASQPGRKRGRNTGLYIGAGAATTALAMLALCAVSFYAYRALVPPPAAPKHDPEGKIAADGKTTKKDATTEAPRDTDKAKKTPPKSRLLPTRSGRRS